MRILSRYIGILFLKNWLLCLGSLTALIMTEQYLTGLMEGSIPRQHLAYYHFSSTLSVLVQLAPPAAMFGTLLTLSGLNRTHELVALYSIGIGLWRIMGVVLSVAFVACCVLLVLQDRVLPVIHRTRVSYYWREIKGKQDFFLDVKTDKIWYRSQDKIYNIRSFDPGSKSVTGMAVFSLNSRFEIESVTDAETASYDGNQWVLYRGTQTNFSPQDGSPQTRAFKKLSLTLGETPKDFVEIEKEVDGLRLKELFTYIARVRKTGASVRQHEVNAHQRISLSFAPMIMCLFAIPFGTRIGRRDSGGIGRDLGLALALTFLYWILYSLSISLGKSGALNPAVSAWLPSLVFVSVFAYLLNRKKP